MLRGPGNVLQAIVDEPESMSAWELGLKGEAEQIGVTGARLKLVEAGPVRAVLRVEQTFRHSLFRQEIILGRRLPRVDVRLWMDWQERNLMIKCAFPAALQNPAAVFEIPFGAIGRPANGREVVALRWADLSEPGGGYGLSLLNDCKYGYDAQGSVLRLSLVHGATQPDPEADRGEQSLLYSLYPHAGDWQAAGTLRRGYELNNPLIPWPALVHSGALPAAHSFISVLPENVVLSLDQEGVGLLQPRPGAAALRSVRPPHPGPPDRALAGGSLGVRPAGKAPGPAGLAGGPDCPGDESL